MPTPVARFRKFLNTFYSRLLDVAKRFRFESTSAPLSAETFAGRFAPLSAASVRRILSRVCCVVVIFFLRSSEAVVGEMAMLRSFSRLIVCRVPRVRFVSPTARAIALLALMQSAVSPACFSYGAYVYMCLHLLVFFFFFFCPRILCDRGRLHRARRASLLSCSTN